MDGMSDIDDWLDHLGVDPADARDATHVRRIIAAGTEDERVAAVAAARAAGDSWAVIAVALGVSQGDAQRRYG
ncbi:MAG: hypothetical protein U5N53_30940 [Mycobacterium sp.]|nr:hypothetical protein [Mycobacterium sp.]